MMVDTAICMMNDQLEALLVRMKDIRLPGIAGR